MTQGLGHVISVDLDQKTIKKNKKINIKVLNIEAEVDLHHEGKDQNQETEKKINIENIMKSILAQDQDKKIRTNIKTKKIYPYKYLCHLFLHKFLCHPYQANNVDEGSVPDPL